VSRDALILAAARTRLTAALGRHDLGAARIALSQLRDLYVGAQGPPRAMAAAYAELGDFGCLADDYPAALVAYDQAIALQPDQARYWFNRAAVRRFLGELELAERDYDTALRLDPADGQAWLNRSDLRAQSPQRNHVPELQAALAAGSEDWRFRVPLRYALAKEYEDLGDFAKSWQHLHEGAQLRRQFLQYDPQIDLDTVEWLRAAFPSVPAAPPPRTPSGPQPVFIVGLPRTGSTLVDQILGNHSGVYSAGELTDFGATVIGHAREKLRGARGASVQPTRNELVMASAQLDFVALGADYMRRVQPRLPQRSAALQRFTDKLPLNYLYCGLIARALPAARMVHVTRAPMAVCYAMYKVLFDQGYPFSYDLGEIADYYIGYRQLMAHWQATLPGRIYPIAYEDLVHDPEGQSRALLAALELPWQDGCLQPHQNLAPVATASAAQVRRPIYSSSVALWRRYASQLAPVSARLSAAGIAWDL
jgi:tetratricopeptide (TPR) repeat protein